MIATISKFLFVFAACMFGLACIEKKADATFEPVAFENVCRAESDGKFVSIKGYLALPPTVSCRGSECQLELRSTQYGGEKIGIEIYVGNRPGQMRDCLTSIPIQISSCIQQQGSPRIQICSNSRAKYGSPIS
jgi:hypothetical protein